MNILTEKEWLDLAWKYFQQHAQQRISYFNFFIVFSTILTSCFVSTFQSSFLLPRLGIVLGGLEVLISYIFLKIDIRNKFMTRQAEKVIQEMEYQCNLSGGKSYSLFTGVAEATASLKLENSGKFFLKKHLTHGQAYQIIYGAFLFLGITMVIGSAFR